MARYKAALACKIISTDLEGHDLAVSRRNPVGSSALPAARCSKGRSTATTPGLNGVDSLS